jgi:hypothetical protein
MDTEGTMIYLHIALMVAILILVAASLQSYAIHVDPMYNIFSSFSSPIYNQEEQQEIGYQVGVLDDYEFDDYDKARIEALARASVHGWRANDYPHVTRYDVELLRQNVRRAIAAYPELKPSEILSERFMRIDVNSRIPLEWMHSTCDSQMVDGKWYATNMCSLVFVKPEFFRRASPKQTNLYLDAEKKVVELKK